MTNPSAKVDASGTEDGVLMAISRKEARHGQEDARFAHENLVEDIGSKEREVERMKEQIAGMQLSIEKRTEVVALVTQLAEALVDDTPPQL
ncbi:hypothetical protein COY05_03395 [Candidatus Peregrinibacteria bacterium CG_4_10_14_0_2_um_filter_38_24]|nr:MAG: hypothetical protein COY05_03395 [Candidatus Peregrinibacteria bacterium CG_4_10_14_0_2_um_filter_38_24]PJC38774.1 MAG: hypothetical protein CO044_03165 [Candidatus Peregrinibacteria bacterium CG_4_9_14_0_2_um_filter_38_9]